MTAGRPVPTGPPPDFAALLRERRFADAEATARRLLQADAGNGDLWKVLGIALAAQGRAAQALQAKRKAVELLPDDAHAHGNLANSLVREGLADEAIRHFQQAIRLSPGHASAWQGLAHAFMLRQEPEQAVDTLQRFVAAAPADAGRHNDLGNLYRDLHRMPEAERCFRQALALDPALPAAANNLANTLLDLGCVAEAEHWYREAIRLGPPKAEVHSNLGNLLKEQGRLAEAQAAYRAALDLQPDLDAAWTNLLLTLNNDPRVPGQAALEAARRYGAILQRRAGAPLAAPGAPRHRPMRVGFVSGDLRRHPVGYFLEGWLPHVDRARVQPIAYSSFPFEDDLSARLRRQFAQWHPLHGVRAEAAARLVRSHGIDVLVDLSGHTAHTRLDLFAWKPAPVQASWLGYFATTGLPAMDWVIADAHGVPPGDEHHFTERVWRLPRTRLCFAAPADAPPVAPAPCVSNGFVTFGSFQNLGKVNDGVLQAWSRVLAAVPGSRLRVQSPPLADTAARQAFCARLAAAGIDPARVTLHGRTSRTAYLQAHAEVDLLLDTFPFPGGTTTCEALWMGVPTVTLAGDRLLSRQGAALLRVAGLEAFVARDLDAYQAIALHWARDPRALQSLRETLRARVAASPLFDGAAFARDFVQAMEAMAGTA